MAFTCPTCQSVSFNPTDEHEGYCARCKTWTGNRLFLGADKAQLARMRQYVLTAGNEPVLADDFAAEAFRRDAARCQVGRRIVRRRGVKVLISTVFNGVPAGEANGPLLFETMVFGLPQFRGAIRYASWAEAEGGHEAVVVFIRKLLQVF